MLRLLLPTLLAAILSLSALPGPSTASAQSGDEVERARRLFQEGQQAYERGRFQIAADRMRAAYELTGSAELAFNVARVYERMSNYDEAIRFFLTYCRKADLEDKDHVDVNERIDAMREAKKRQRELVFTAPPSEDELTREARTFFERGVAMFEQGHHEAAMQAFTAAQRFAPLPEIYYNMAVVSERMGNLRDAIDFYREYLRHRDDAPDRGYVEREIERLRDKRRNR